MTKEGAAEYTFERVRDKGKNGRGAWVSAGYIHPRARA